MGYALKSDNPSVTELYFDDSQWEKLIQVPNWNRSGTKAPSIEEARKQELVENDQEYMEAYGNWDGNYLRHRAGQLVEASDAASLGKVWQKRLENFTDDWIIKGELQEFIDLCLKGGFRIY